MKRETKCQLIAAKNNTIRVIYVKAIIDKTKENRKFRFCGDRDEMVNHLISECSKIVQKK